MDSINVYSKWLIENIHKKRISEKFMKPNKNLHFTSSQLYYYFDTENFSPSKIKDTINANLSLMKTDLLDDLELTQNLYETNPDGSFNISKLY